MFTISKIEPVKPVSSPVSLRDIITMARNLMDSHGLKDWKFDFDRSLTRYGLCSYKRKTISISYKLASKNTIERTRRTILHEIAHALTPGAGHGYAWQVKASSLGIPPERCFTQKTTALIEHTFKGTCTGCNLSVKRFRRRKLQCLRCRLPLVWTQNG